MSSEYNIQSIEERKSILEENLHNIWERSKRLIPSSELHTLSPPLTDFTNAPECLIPHIEVSRTLVFGGYWYEYTGEIIEKSAHTEFLIDSVSGIIIGYNGCTHWHYLIMSSNNKYVNVGEVWDLGDVDWIKQADSFQEYASEYRSIGTEW